MLVDHNAQGHNKFILVALQNFLFSRLLFFVSSFFSKYCSSVKLCQPTQLPVGLRPHLHSAMLNSQIVYTLDIVYNFILTNIYIIFVTSSFIFSTYVYCPNILICTLEDRRATSVALLIVLPNSS